MTILEQLGFREIPHGTPYIREVVCTRCDTHFGCQDTGVVMMTRDVFRHARECEHEHGHPDNAESGQSGSGTMPTTEKD